MKLPARSRAEPVAPAVKYPGVQTALDGSSAVLAVEMAASEGASAYPVMPSTRMGDGWALAVAQGRSNVHGRRLVFFEAESEHAAAAVVAGMSMVGLRAVTFSSGQGIAHLHDSLYAAAGKRLTYVLNVAARAMTKHALTVHTGHDDYHAADDTGFFQLFAKDVQEAADLTLMAHRIAELSLNPGLCAQDGFLTSHVIETSRLPERALIREYLGHPADLIESPTPAQRLVFGERRRRIPELFDLDYPAMLGAVQNQDSYAQGVAAQRPFYFDHVAALADRAMAEFAVLTGRRYARASDYRLADAEYVIAGQGSVVADAEAVVDHLRDARGLKIGVLNLTMFRPFPADLITRLLDGKRALVVLERTDQPLAADSPLLREIRAALSQAVENGRARRTANGRAAGPLPYPTLAALAPDRIPDCYAGCFGLGGRDLQPGDIVAAVNNMLPRGGGRRRFYLGVDFVRSETRLPKLQIWQQQLLDTYPDLAGLALPSAGELDLLPKGSIAFRIHSVGGWDATTMGKNVALTARQLLGLHVKAHPKHESERKGQPTTFYGILAPEAIRLNGEPKQIDVVLSPDPNVFRHSDPLAGLAAGGAFVIQSDQPLALWRSLPPAGRRTMIEKRIRLFCVDAFRIADEETSDPELRYRMQGAAFLGAFFAAGPVMARYGLDEARLFDGIRVRLFETLGHLGERAVENNLRVIRRGFEEVRAVEAEALEGDNAMPGRVPTIPPAMDVPSARPGLGDPGHFWEQVCFLCTQGQDGIADPFAAFGAVPAATSAVRDMTNVRLEVPAFVAEKCTGCAECWVQCPDSAIPGLVHTVDDLLDTATASAADHRPMDRMKQVSKHLARECRTLLAGTPFTGFGNVLAVAYEAVSAKLGWDAGRRAELDAQFAPVYAALAEFPLARTRPFFDVPEAEAKGTGGLLSITVNPETCRGCNLCVEVCSEGALVTVKQDEAIVEKLQRNWALWRKLPDTPDRYIDAARLEEGIGTLSSLLLKKQNYLSMIGGDGACPGCGEKTVAHLVLAAIHALMQPRVNNHIARLNAFIQGLDAKGRELLAADADLTRAAQGAGERAEVSLSIGNKARLERIVDLIQQLQDLRWRYTHGPGGRGRAHLGMTNATGCSSLWDSTYPYNPYPFPWVNHSFQDAPSVAVGIFEGHMRKMADGFLAVRRAELELADTYDPEIHEKELAGFDWTRFTDEEFALCPPIVATGGDGAMLDAGFQNLSRLLASGKPVRVLVLNSQVSSSVGGRARTSGHTGHASDTPDGEPARRGGSEMSKELGLLALAHRGAFVHQSSQASASHLLAGVLRGLQSRRPAVFNLYCPCPVSHGLADAGALRAARLALESRAFPFLTYDPDAGQAFADCLGLDGNPAVEDLWPTHTLTYLTDAGETTSMKLPLTIADWAFTEGRFAKHFRELPQDGWNEDQVPFHEYLERDAAGRAGKVPFVFAVNGARRVRRLSVSPEIVALAEERRLFWSQLRQLAGLEIPETVRTRVAEALKGEYEQRESAIRAEYDAKIAELRASYPQVVARRLAEGLIKAGDGRTVADLVAVAMAMPAAAIPRAVAVPAFDAPPGSRPPDGAASPAVPQTVVVLPGSAGPQPAPADTATIPAPPAEGEALVMEPYIDTLLCTSCNECTNLNSQLFAYDENKQAFIKDPRRGTFAQLVRAAELCPVKIIHPGTPLNPKERDVEKWIARAAPFN